MPNQDNRCDFRTGYNEGREECLSNRPMPADTVTYLRTHFPHGFASPEYWEGYAAGVRSVTPLDSAHDSGIIPGKLKASRVWVAFLAAIILICYEFVMKGCN